MDSGSIPDASTKFMKTRLKTRQIPGDVNRRTKAGMLEGRHPDKKQSKSFKKLILARERTVLRERTWLEVQGQLESSEDA